MNDREAGCRSHPDVRLAPPLDFAALREIERHLHLRCNKWDTQVGDVNVLSEQPLVLPGREWDLLCRSAERLAAETTRLESIVLERPRCQSSIGVPGAIREALAAEKKRRSEGTMPPARAMRFDFHPTTSGWCVSEVNSDVPGGWSEGTSLPPLYQPFYKDLDCPESPLDAWGNAIQSLVPDGYVALLSAPGYLEDEQVVRAFMHELQSRRVPCSMIQTPAALQWYSHGCRLRRSGERVSVVIRFYQVEWLCALPERAGWKQLLNASETQVINPAISAISESKRFPLAFNQAPECLAWRAVMPECRDPRDVDLADWDGWVLKACYSNTGDQVQICGSIPRRQQRQVIRQAQRNPSRWIAQRRFETLPVKSCRGPMYPCVGVFVVNGCAAGAYARLSGGQVTDGAAVEAPLLIDRSVS
jgi:hypothetical protein